MALSKTWVTPAEIAAGVSDRDFLNAQLGNLMLVIESVLMAGDDGTSSKYHRHGSSTLGNRPAAGNSGRIWRVTDIGDGIDMRDDGTKWVPLGVQVLERELTQTDVVDDATETSIYSFSVPADLLGATGGLRLHLSGDYLNNSGASRTLVVKVKLGATTVLTTQATTHAAGANRRKWSIDPWFLNSATNAQKWGADIHISADLADTFAVNINSAAANLFYCGAGSASSAEDTTGALTLDVTVQHSAAHASLSMRKEMALLEVLPAA